MTTREVDSSLPDRGHSYAPAHVQDYAKVHQGDIHQQNIYHNYEDDTRKKDVTKALHYDGANNRLDQLALPNIPVASWDWIWTTPFAAWLAGPDPFYWITGKPGSGKSTLMHHLIRSATTRERLNLSKQKRRQIIEFFFDFRAGSNTANDVKGLLCSFLAQLRNYSQEVDDALTRFDSATPLAGLSISGLEDCCCHMLNTYAPAVCAFVDGLDEYHADLFELADTLIRLQNRTGMKMVLASRSESEFKAKFASFAFLEMHKHNQECITIYIDQSLERARQVLPDVDTVFSASLCSRILARAEGVIIWVRLAIDELLQSVRGGASGTTLSEVLDALPEKLEQMYTRILKRGTVQMYQSRTLLLSLIGWNDGEMSADILRDWWSYFHPSSKLSGATELLSRLASLLGVLVEVSTGSPSGSSDYRRAKRLFGEKPEKIRFIHETLRGYCLTVLTTPEIIRDQLNFSTTPRIYLHLCMGVAKTAAHEPMNKVHYPVPALQALPWPARSFGKLGHVGEALVCHALHYMKNEMDHLDMEIPETYPVMQEVFIAFFKLVASHDRQNHWGLFEHRRGNTFDDALDVSAFSGQEQCDTTFQSLIAAGVFYCPQFILNGFRTSAGLTHKDRQRILCHALLQAIYRYTYHHIRWPKTKQMLCARLIFNVHQICDYISYEQMCVYALLFTITAPFSSDYFMAVLSQERPVQFVREDIKFQRTLCHPLCQWMQAGGPFLDWKVFLRVMSKNPAQFSISCRDHKDVLLDYESPRDSGLVLAKFTTMLKTGVAPIVFEVFGQSLPTSHSVLFKKLASVITKANLWGERQRYIYGLMKYHRKHGEWPSPIPKRPPILDINGFGRAFDEWEIDSSGLPQFTDEEKERLRIAAQELDITLQEDLR